MSTEAEPTAKPKPSALMSLCRIILAIWLFWLAADWLSSKPTAPKPAAPAAPGSMQETLGAAAARTEQQIRELRIRNGYDPDPQNESFSQYLERKRFGHPLDR